eukprot:1043691-Pelagomonas_calceolata.AAC.3
MSQGAPRICRPNSPLVFGDIALVHSSISTEGPEAKSGNVIHLLCFTTLLSYMLLRTQVQQVHKELMSSASALAPGGDMEAVNRALPGLLYVDGQCLYGGKVRAVAHVLYLCTGVPAQGMKCVTTASACTVLRCMQWCMLPFSVLAQGMKCVLAARSCMVAQCMQCIRVRGVMSLCMYSDGQCLSGLM